MKRLLILVSLLALVASASAASLTFQNPGDFSAQVSAGGSSPSSNWLVSWGGLVNLSIGKNAYVSTYSMVGTASCYFYNSPPGDPTTYAAASLIGGTSTSNSLKPYIILLDTDGTTPLYTWTDVIPLPGAAGRYEVKMVGANAQIWKDNVLLATSGDLARNPSFVGFGTITAPAFAGAHFWDDFVYGSSTQRFIFDMPQTNSFIIKRDLLNPADRGIAFAGNGTVINAHQMWSQFGVPNQLNESIILQNFGDGNTVATAYPGTAMSNELDWDLDAAIFNNPVARYGNYVIRSTNASAILPSEYITYEGFGASCTWSASSFVPLDTGTVSWAISSGGYWNTTGYDYKLCVINPVGAFVQNTSIIAQTGSANYQFTTTDPQGIYTAVVMAIPHAGGAEIWMTADYANLFQYVSFAGYVNGAQYAIPIPAGAHYNLTQGAIIQQGDTLADGSYNATGFLTGSNVTINVTAANHRQYYVEIQPLNPRRVELNITLVPTNVSEIGSSIGGVLRTGSLNGTIVSKGFGEPITSATVTASNATEVYTNVSNNAAWYLFDNTNAALVSGRLYTINATKAGYGTQSYQVAAP